MSSSGDALGRSQEQVQKRFLRVQSVFGLVEDNRSIAVQHVIRYLIPTMSR
jgi:hypothetical protein